MTEYFTQEQQLPDNLGRAGVIHTPHGDIKTPAFIPVGTQATVKAVLPEMIKDASAQAVLSNAYHLYLQPGAEIVEQAGGLAKFMHWDGPTYTDSGGFQVLSLGGSNQKKVLSMDVDNSTVVHSDKPNKDGLVRVDDDGVNFISHRDGSKHRFTPEKSMQIQHQIGADIIFAFDELTTLANTRQYQEKSLERTRLWAIRCLQEHNKLTVERPDKPVQALWAVVQGAQYEDLRRKAAKDLVAISEQDEAKGGIGYGGIGIGGAIDKNNLGNIVHWVTSELPVNKPRHLLGISEPDDLFWAIENGADTFDCVSPSRVARNGAVYSLDGRYNITNARFKNDFSPIDPEIENYSSQYSRAYIHHLFRAKEFLAATICTLHNEHFILTLVNNIRDSILQGNYYEYKNQFLSRYYG